MAGGWVRITAHLASRDSYASGFREVLDHFGVRPEYVEPLVPSDLNRTNILVLAGYDTLPATKREGISDWVKNGGCLICVGSAWGMEELLGIASQGRVLSQGCAVPVKASDLWPENSPSIWFAGGSAHKPSGCEVIASLEDGYVALGRARHGRGIAIFIAPHLGQNTLMHQLGRSVESDGLGAADGSARLDDGILRAEDGTYYDFDRHRDQVPGAPPHFGAAFSDRAKELLLQAILHGVEHSGQAIILPWFWPDQGHAAACLTLECDDNDTEGVVAVHRMLAHLGIPAAWTIQMPGYSNDVYRTIRAREHEVALLFSLDETRPWVEERMRSQITQLGRMASDPHVTAARPANGGWYRRTKFYDMCEHGGARVSLSKGGRQPGTQGFLFGTCHPFFPPRADGSVGHVMELPYQLAQIGQVAANEVADAVVEEVKSRHGCLHFVQPPLSFKDNHSANEIRRVITNLRMDKVVFLKPSEIYRYERARRQIRMISKSVDGELLLSLIAESDVPGFSLVTFGVHGPIHLNGKEIAGPKVTRFGRSWRAITTDMEGKRQVDLKLKVAALSEAA